MKTNNKITVFYACDDKYIPCLSVSITSLIENSNSNNSYEIIILCNNLLKDNTDRIKALETDNIKINFINVSDKLKNIADELSLRDYYSLSIYYRLFIPNMFKNIDKAVYLDSDTVVLTDIARIFETPIENRLAAVVSDAVIESEETFIRYAEEAVGVKYNRYFNSGMMFMNLAEMRKIGLQERFTYLLKKYHFNTICPDQDYLNVICKDKVVYLDKGWNKMTVDQDSEDELKIIHYNMYFKPWLYDNVPYENYFWKYAEKSPYYNELSAEKSNFGESEKRLDIKAGDNLRSSALAIINETTNFKNTLFIKEEAV